MYLILYSPQPRPVNQAHQSAAQDPQPIKKFNLFISRVISRYDTILNPWDGPRKIWLSAERSPPNPGMNIQSGGPLGPARARYVALNSVGNNHI